MEEYWGINSLDKVALTKHARIRLKERGIRMDNIVGAIGNGEISGIEEKVISLYARGMSTRDIHDQLQDLYGIELPAEMVSKVTDKILPQAKEWKSRPLNPVYQRCVIHMLRNSFKYVNYNDLYLSVPVL